MHAYLLIRGGVQELAKKLEAKVLEFPLQKIEDTRELNKLLRLSFNEKTLIVLRNIQDATEEALNAFLKNLEEPQENIFFALTASSAAQVLPTIVSRCQIIKTKNIIKTEIETYKDEFLDMNPMQRLQFFDKIKVREEAIRFIDNLIYFLHEKGELNNMETLLETRTRLKANGNVNLHLSNLAIQFK